MSKEGMFAERRGYHEYIRMVEVRLRLMPRITQPCGCGMGEERRQQIERGRATLFISFDNTKHTTGVGES